MEPTMPEPGSYEEFHAIVLNQLERFYTNSFGPCDLALPPVRTLLAQDIAGNLWQGFVQEAQAKAAQ